MTFDQEKRSVEVPLGCCYDKKSVVPLGRYSARHLSPLGHIKKTRVDNLSADVVSLG